jgi:hypothetical protein
MAHVPCGFFFLESHDSLNVQGTDSLLCIQHQERHGEPFPQGTLSILKDGPADYRVTVPIPSTTISLLANPVEWTMGYVKDFLATALGAVDSIGPTLRYQITLAGFFVREASRCSLSVMHYE